MTDELDQIFRCARQVPAFWRGWPPARALEYLRLRLNVSQAELARRAGLSASRLSLIEGGADARMSTWRAIYRALGLELLVLPSSQLSARRLEDHEESLCPPHRRRRSRARPRRRKGGRLGPRPEL